MSAQKVFAQCSPITERAVSELRPHPENSLIFGDPGESPEYGEILKSIRTHGIWEPLVIKPDGTILSGHLRFACAEKLGLKSVPVRVAGTFASYLDEVKFVVRSNTDRRQLRRSEIARAFARLKEIPRADGGAKAKRGRPSKTAYTPPADGPHGDPSAPDEKGGTSATFSKTRDEAARVLHVSTHEARACEEVFLTPGVPQVLKDAVDANKVAPIPAARAVRRELKQQGGAISNPNPLEALAQKGKGRASSPSDHDCRLQEKADAYRISYAALVKAYKEIDRALTRVPLASLLGPTEHHEYRDVLRDIVARTVREIQAVEGPESLKRQMTLTVIKGGRA